MAVSASPVRAQAVVPDSVHKAPSAVVPQVRGVLLTRAEIAARAEAAERVATDEDSSEIVRQDMRDLAVMLRERLAEGDFRVGDRLVIEFQADKPVTDTVVVRSGGLVSLPGIPGIPDVSLLGVVRAEANEYLTAQYARYVKTPTVKVTALVRLAVLGSVKKPGFYVMPSDLLVSDAIMIAGGPGSDAGMDKIVARRGTGEVVKARRMRAAVQDGVTLDQLDFRSGDELVVGEKRGSFWSSLRNATPLIALAASLYGLSRVRSGGRR